MKNFLEHFASAAAPFVQHWEGLRTSAYKCPLGVWTIGYGRTNGVHEGDTCTKEQAAQWLLEDLTDTACPLYQCPGYGEPIHRARIPCIQHRR